MFTIFMVLALVTGAGGFVGVYLCAELLQRGHKVRAMIRRRADNHIPQKLIELQKIFGENLSIIRGDVTNWYDVLLAVSQAKWVFHLASQSFVPDSVENPSYSFEVNTKGTQNVLDVARLYHSHSPRIVFASSSEVFGLQGANELPISETNPTRPQSPYATSKLAAETLCRNYYDNFGVDVIISRAFNHEGAGRGHHFVTASIVRQLVMVQKGETDKLYIGDVTPSRDWSHVEDVVNAYILLAEKGQAGEIYVVGSGVALTIQEFIEKTAKLLGIEGKFDIVHQKDRERRTDVPRLLADAKKIRKLGWEPKHNLARIIVQMANYYFDMTKEQRMSIRS